ncbi:sigma-70 family RNA polymerase sigma factor [Myxococcota bacterium]|nr:sigma-70 family RNA polymerase sigma factor [Myxococcota bacterium]
METRTTSKMDERTLVAALRCGDERAFAQLVEDNTGRLLAVAKRIVRNPEDANDAVQNAFLQAFRAIGRFEGESKLSTWLHRITVNACLLRLRHAKRHPEAAIDDLLPHFDETGHRLGTDADTDWPEDAPRQLEKHQLGKVVRDAIERLPENFRIVVTLRDIEGMSTEETAMALGIRPEAAKMRLHRARQALRTLLEPHFGERVA